MKITSLLVVLFTIGTTASAFLIPSPTSSRPNLVRQSGLAVMMMMMMTTTPSLIMDDVFYQAVQAASIGKNHGLNLDELDRLATALEDVEGCNFEDDEFCEKEVQDRLDVAEILRLQIELQLR